MSQQKAERAVEVARLKAKKLEEIDKLKELEVLQREALLNPKSNKNVVMRKIRESASPIGTSRKEHVAIESVFDNTIAAIKVRIEKRQQTEKILHNKRTWLKRNEMQRNKILNMEYQIQQHLKEIKQFNMERVKKLKLNSYRKLQQQIQKECTKLKQLGNIEREMIAKLNNTRLIENSHIRASVKVLDAIQAKQVNKSYTENKDSKYIDQTVSACRNLSNKSLI